jgi:integrase
MLKRAAEWKVIAALPCRIRLLKVDRTEVSFYDFSEYRRLVEASAAIDPRIELLALLGGDAGLRRGEAIAMERTSTSSVGTSTCGAASGTGTSPRPRAGARVASR